jgi:hypothetical protein
VDSSDCKRVANTSTDKTTKADVVGEVFHNDLIASFCPSASTMIGYSSYCTEPYQLLTSFTDYQRVGVSVTL